MEDLRKRDRIAFSPEQSNFTVGNKFIASSDSLREMITRTEKGRESISQSAACPELVWNRGIFSGHPPAAGWTAAGVVLNKLGPMGELFSSATAQPFLFAFTLFQTKRQ